jgi:hypothetical protein
MRHEELEQAILDAAATAATAAAPSVMARTTNPASASFRGSGSIEATSRSTMRICLFVCAASIDAATLERCSFTFR